MDELSTTNWILIVGVGAVCWTIASAADRIIQAIMDLNARVERFEERYLNDDDEDLYP